jgi:hypothetical protein
MVCDTDEEFRAALRAVDRWNRNHGYGPAWTDPGFGPRLKTLEAARQGNCRMGSNLEVCGRTSPGHAPP